MAALTTFAAGAAMMPTRMLAYQELGTFLMLWASSVKIWVSYFSGSAVFMAALTMFAAGAAMMPTRMLAY